MDALAEYYGLAGFLIIAGLYSFIVDRTALSRRTLSAAMDAERRRWMMQVAARPVRIMDAQIIAGLQNGIAFFASTALLGIGAAFTLLTAIDPIMSAFGDLAFAVTGSRTQWTVIAIGLVIIYAYAFFKFGWAYRLTNYSAVLLGAAAEREDEEAAQKATARAAEMNVVAGRQFNRGMRTLFFSIGYLAWIAGPMAQIVTTLVIVALLTYRQFASPALTALRD